jgi:hypothetical protein
MCRVLGLEDAVLSETYRTELQAAANRYRVEWCTRAASGKTKLLHKIERPRAPDLKAVMRESVKCAEQLATPQTVWLSLADAILPAPNTALRVDLLPENGQVYRAHTPTEAQLRDQSVAPLEDDPVLAFVRKVLRADDVRCPPNLDWMTVVPSKCRARAWVAYRKMAFLFMALSPPSHPSQACRSLATMILGYYSSDSWMRPHPDAWKEWVYLHSRSAVAQFLANAALQYSQHWSCPLGVDTVLRQVQAAKERFRVKEGDTLALEVDAEHSPWVRSELVKRFRLPPGDMCAFCPRCGEARSMVNQLVTQTGSTAVRCQRAEVVTGWADVLVDSVANLCFCRREKGKKAPLCSKVGCFECLLWERWLTVRSKRRRHSLPSPCSGDSWASAADCTACVHSPGARCCSNCRLNAGPECLPRTNAASTCARTAHGKGRCREKRLYSTNGSARTDARRTKKKTERWGRARDLKKRSVDFNTANPGLKLPVNWRTRLHLSNSFFLGLEHATTTCGMRLRRVVRPAYGLHVRGLGRLGDGFGAVESTLLSAPCETTRAKSPVC